MEGMSDFLIKIAEREHLSVPDAGRVFQIIMNGGATPAEIAAVLMGLRINGETVDEISGAAMALRAKAKKFVVPEHLKSRIVDTCGTGGDGKGTYNISTAVAFVAAACGVPVTKHGNRAVSSRSGSADVLKALGVDIEAGDHIMQEALEEAGICFLMAPKYHSAMRHVAPVRQNLGMRTIFNLLGPLSNPAMAERQLIGVYDKKWVGPLAHVLDQLGSTHAWVVHGADGMDEITTTDITHAAELKDGKVREFTIKPEDYGIERVAEEDLLGGDIRHNASALQAVLEGKGKEAYRDIVLLNSAAALVVGGRAVDIKMGIKMAMEAIETGKAIATLKKLVEVSNKLH